MPDLSSMGGMIPGMSTFGDAAKGIPGLSSMGSMMPGRSARAVDAEPEVWHLNYLFFFSHNNNIIEKTLFIFYRKYNINSFVTKNNNNDLHKKKYQTSMNILFSFSSTRTANSIAYSKGTSRRIHSNQKWLDNIPMAISIGFIDLILVCKFIVDIQMSNKIFKLF